MPRQSNAEEKGDRLKNSGDHTSEPLSSSVDFRHNEDEGFASAPEDSAGQPKSGDSARVIPSQEAMDGNMRAHYGLHVRQIMTAVTMRGPSLADDSGAPAPALAKPIHHQIICIDCGYGS